MSVDEENPLVVRLSDLAASERDRYYQFIVEQNIQFYEDGEGNYVANVRMVPPGYGSEHQLTAAERASLARVRRALCRFPSAALTCAAPTPQLKTQQLLLKQGDKYGRRASRPPLEMARMVDAITRAQELAEFSVYPKFSALVTSRAQLRPKKRPLGWLMRLIEEVYDARFTHDTADMRAEDDAGSSDDSESRAGDGERRGSSRKADRDAHERLSNNFPVFVVDFFSKRYGLRRLVDQTCWDLLFNTHALRKEHQEVELFARFLEEYYDPDDLLFFLYVRDVVQREVGINFRARWSELGSASGAGPAARAKGRRSRAVRPGAAGVFLSHRACSMVARTVFMGAEQQPLCRSFMRRVEAAMSGSKEPEADTRRIEVSEYLHIALGAYHEARPADDTSGAVPAAGGSSADHDSAAALQRTRVRLDAGQQVGADEAAALWASGVGGDDEDSAGGDSRPASPTQPATRAEQLALFREAEAAYKARMRQLAAATASAGAAVEPDDSLVVVRHQEMEQALRAVVRERRASGVGGWLGDAKQDERRVREWAGQLLQAQQQQQQQQRQQDEGAESEQEEEEDEAAGMAWAQHGDMGAGDTDNEKEQQQEEEAEAEEEARRALMEASPGELDGSTERELAAFMDGVARDRALIDRVQQQLGSGSPSLQGQAPSAGASAAPPPPPPPPRNVAATPASATPSAAAAADGRSSTPQGEALAAARRALLFALSQHMHDANDRFIETVMVAATRADAAAAAGGAALPDDVVAQVQEEVQKQLEEKVEQTLKHIVTERAPATREAAEEFEAALADAELAALRDAYQSLLRQARLRAGAGVGADDVVDDATHEHLASLTEGVLALSSVRDEVEAFAELLLNFARERFGA